MRCCSGLDSGFRRNDGEERRTALVSAAVTGKIDVRVPRKDGRELRTALISAAVTGKIDVRCEG